MYLWLSPSLRLHGFALQLISLGLIGVHKAFCGSSSIGEAIDCDFSSHSVGFPLES